MIHNEEKNQPNKNVSEMIQMIELVDRDIKIIIIKMVFYTVKMLEKKINMLCVYFYEGHKNTQIKCPEMIYPMPEIKNILDGIINRLYIA